MYKLEDNIYRFNNHKFIGSFWVNLLDNARAQCRPIQGMEHRLILNIQKAKVVDLFFTWLFEASAGTML